MYLTSTSSNEDQMRSKAIFNKHELFVPLHSECRKLKVIIQNNISMNAVLAQKYEHDELNCFNVQYLTLKRSYHLFSPEFHL